MKDHQHDLYVGAPRNASHRKTVEVFTRKLKKNGTLKGVRLLDVGCGDGAFTVVLAEGFQEVCGIDVQESYLAHFREAVQGDNRYSIANMSASQMTFPAEHFDSIVTIETLEHVEDL